MKKRLLVLSLLIINFFAFAEFSVGLRGGFTTDLGSVFPENTQSSLDAYEREGYKLSVPKYNSFNAVLSANYFLPIQVVKGLGVQIEIGYLNNNGKSYEVKKGDIRYEQTYTYKSLEIPLLALYEYSFGSFKLGALFGINMSFPLGDIDYVSDVTLGETVQVETTTPCVFGLTGGILAAYKLGIGDITLDVRYLTDTMTFETVDVARFLRSNFTASLGYRVVFGK